MAAPFRKATGSRETPRSQAYRERIGLMVQERETQATLERLGITHLLHLFNPYPPAIEGALPAFQFPLEQSVCQYTLPLRNSPTVTNPGKSIEHYSSKTGLTSLHADSTLLSVSKENDISPLVNESPILQVAKLPVGQEPSLPVKIRAESAAPSSCPPSSVAYSSAQVQKPLDSAAPPRSLSSSPHLRKTRKKNPSDADTIGITTTIPAILHHLDGEVLRHLVDRSKRYLLSSPLLGTMLQNPKGSLSSMDKRDALIGGFSSHSYHHPPRIKWTCSSELVC